MKETRLTLPELGLIAGTRGMLGTGAGLLLADRFSKSQRKMLGWTLFLAGAISTIPLAMTVFGRRDSTEDAESPRNKRRANRRVEPESVAT